MKRSPIGKCVDVLFGIFQEINGGVGSCCIAPFSLAYVRVFGQMVGSATMQAPQCFGWHGDTSAGIIMEVCGTTCMKLSDGFSNLVPSVLTFVFWGIAFTIFIFALKTFDLSFAYAVWVGSGIVIVSIIGILHLRTRKCSRRSVQ